MSADTFNASVYLIDRQVEAGLGGHLAVTGPAGSLTYAELAARTAELASGFRASGVRPEEVAKLFFAYGLGNSLLFPFSAGATAVLDPARATPGGAADGFYTCLGRSNDMIKASGIWVSPMEVEGRLLEHPSVAECAVVGHRTTAGLEEVVACVVPAPGQSVDADGLIAFCREGLASFKRPRQVLPLNALPKTATGKIQRVVVREVVAQRLGKPEE